MNNNLIDEDDKAVKKRLAIFKVIGTIGAIISGICTLLTLFAGDFSLEAFGLFVICILMTIVKR